MTDEPMTRLLNGELPKMVSWYDPRLLTRIGIRTIVSSVFGQYADQRLIQAATDPADDATLLSRYDYRDPTSDDAMKRVALDREGAYWIDYIADIGDGFDCTYAMASLLAAPAIPISGAGTLPSGDILILGGDQCYPQATRENYKKRFVTPYDWAYDIPRPERKLFALPGNHDWYDGLAAFDSLFCSSRDRLSEGKGNAIGGWQCQQHRSYWALRLPYNWWIWGCDIQFSKYLDTSQVNYFATIAKQMGPEDKVILCMAEPAWMLADFHGQDDEQNFFKITTIARDAGARVCAILAGDWHHYNRYYAHDLDVHFITAGGGGSFLHPTHVLKDEINVRWPDRAPPLAADAERTGGALPPPLPGPLPSTRSAKNVEIRLDKPKESTGETTVMRDVGAAVQDVWGPLSGVLRRKKAKRILKPQAPKCYPEKGRSRLLSLRNLLFPFYNYPFAVGIGLIYWIITWQFYAVVGRHDISAGKIDAVGVATQYWELFPYLPLYLIQATLVSISLSLMFLALLAACIWYVEAIDRPGLRRILTKLGVGIAHFLAHVTTMFALGFLFVLINNQLSPPVERYVNSVWQSQTSDKSVVGTVIKEVLEPLSERRESQRKQVQDKADSPTGTMTRSAPPTYTKPGADTTAPGAQGSLSPKTIREILGFVIYPLEMIFIGGLAGGFVWGLYWVLTGFIGRMHAEDAFAALRIKDYKNFLRMRFDRETLTIYPIGVDRVPRRSEWREPDPKSPPSPNNPRLVTAVPIEARLIEQPIVIHADG
jgi:hypothetical protein